MQVWALANQKGGTGKTTTAINLAASLAALGKRVCLLDLDPQAHATLGLSCHVEEEASIARLFLGGASLLALHQAVAGGFHLVPSSACLAEFEAVAERTLRPEQILAQALSELEGRYDWVLLDCPPRAEGVLCANAVRAATTTLLVVETGSFALQGALQARALFAALLEPGVPRPVRILATRFDRRSVLSRELLVAMQARFGDEMLDTVIRRDAALREAAAHGVPVRKLEPLSCGALDHDALARELVELAPDFRARVGACLPRSRPLTALSEARLVPRKE
jgi:chromosome partitioning protein